METKESSIKILPKSNNIGEDITELVGNPPGWILKSGISILGLVVFIFTGLASFIKYPEKITSHGIMTSTNPPIEHSTLVGGIIDTVFFINNTNILKGQEILYIQNNCKASDIVTLEELIIDIENSNLFSKSSPLPKNLQLGDLQENYSLLEMTLQGYLSILDKSYITKQISIIETELLRLNEQNDVLINQKELASRELAINEKDYNRNLSLKSESVISELDMDRSESEFLRFKKEVNTIKNLILENDVRRELLKFELNRISRENIDQEKDLRSRIQEQVNNLKNEIIIWKKNYAVVAQTSGMIAIKSDVVSSATVKSNQVVATILPVTDKTDKFARTLALENGIGRIEIGDKAIIKFEGYPHKEFGTITSSVSLISLLPDKNNKGELLYEITIPLPDTIFTNYNKLIPFSPNKGIKAEIITKDRSLLRRMFNHFLDLIENN